MPRWKPEEEEYLRANAGKGAEAVAEALGRSVWSVRCKASEMGVSLLVRYLCPNCGKHTLAPLQANTGWCRKCSVESSADRAAVKNKRIRAEAAQLEQAAREEEKRRQMIYSDTHRHQKKIRKFRESRQTNDKSPKEGK